MGQSYATADVCYCRAVCSCLHNQSKRTAQCAQSLTLQAQAATLAAPVPRCVVTLSRRRQLCYCAVQRAPRCRRPRRPPSRTPATTQVQLMELNIWCCLSFLLWWPSHDAGVGVHTPSIPNKAGDSSRAGGSLLHKSVCMPASGMQCGPTACSASQQRALISSRLRSGLASSMPAACHCAASIPGAAALTTPSAQRLRAFGSRAKVGRMAMVAHAATLMCCCIAAVWHRGATTPSASSQQIMAYAHSLHSLYTPCTSQRKQR